MTRRLPKTSQSQLASDRLRGEQITALARWTPVIALSSLASCLMVVVSCWTFGSHAYLLGLLLLLTTAHAIAILRARVWMSQGVRVASAGMVRLRIAVVGLIAVVWATMPTMLMPHVGQDQRQLLIYVGAGLMSASVLLSPLLPAALLFACVTTIGILSPMPLLHQSITAQHAFFVIIFMVLTCAISFTQSREFAKRVINEVTLGEQSDFIGLLLREFEENALDFLWEIDANLRLHHVSDRLAEVMRVPAQALDGGCVLSWIDAGTSEAGREGRDTAKVLACLSGRLPFRDMQIVIALGGRPFWLSVSGKPVLDLKGEFQGYRGVGTDITAVHTSDERILYLARYDGLTELPNRTMFREALAQACAQPKPFALLRLDLDGFKTVNDTCGHSTGDLLLAAVADRLRASLSAGDIVARLGGDEFAVLQVDGKAESAALLAQRLIGRVNEPFQIGGFSLTVGLSIGIASECNGLSPDDLLRTADLALYHSKAQGRGTWHFFDPEMAARAQEKNALQADLRHAIDNDGLTLDFQPIVDVLSGEVIGAEALARWNHPVRGAVSPAEFIPVAEDSGLIHPLGAWVLRCACEQAVTWAGKARVAVNLSPTQFRDPGLLDLVDKVLADTGLPAERLELEITESVFLDALDTTLACLHALRSRGIHIALDDFGTGYSSLSYLGSFPFDKVKIDQSFVRDLGVDENALAIIQAIVGMAGSLGMRTTGEGVETAAQARLLQLTGCSQLQGYLFGRPCSSDAIAGVMTVEAPAPMLLLAG
jgi:diguanylate cyclase (GGDEF)-like protein